MQIPDIFSRKEIPMAEYPCSGPIFIKASVAEGSLKITTEDRDSVAVDVTSRHNDTAVEATEVSFNGDTLEIASPQNSGGLFRRDDGIDVIVKAPLDSSARIGVASASVECLGRYEELDVKTASGNVEIQDVTGDVTISSASGRASLGSVGGQLKVRTASGRLEVSDVGGAINAKTASGRMEIGNAGGDVKVKSASGRLEIDSVHRCTVSVKTVSGRVSVGVAPGTGVWLDLDSKSGNIKTGLDTSESPPDHHDLTLEIRTTSGSIDIHRAQQLAAV
jgi:DUF4097 and DUF4098 domain-containing protein YvlB